VNDAPTRRETPANSGATRRGTPRGRLSARTKSAERPRGDSFLQGAAGICALSIAWHPGSFPLKLREARRAIDSCAPL
jgi:hypothetical protein